MSTNILSGREQALSTPSMSSDTGAHRTRPLFRLNAFAIATCCLAIPGVVIAMVSLESSPVIALLVSAVLCGWSEVNGLCGASHVCTLSPMRTTYGGSVWFSAVGAYTVAGIVTASGSGLLLGLAGTLIDLDHATVFFAIVGLAIVLTARELNWLRFSLPQLRRQTNRMWAFEFGPVTAAAMWGAHIGIGFATVIRHGGFLVLVALSLVLGSKYGAAYGAALMAMYWLGRTLPIWVAPLFTDDHARGDVLAELVMRPERVYRWIAAAGLLCAAALAATLAMRAS